MQAILETLSREQILEIARALERQKISIGELCKRHEMYIKNKGVATSTYKKYKQIYKILKEYCEKEGIEYANDFEDWQADRFFDERCKVKSRIVAIIDYIHCKAIFNYARKRKWIRENPFYLPLQVPVKQCKEWWTKEYFNDLIAAIRSHCASHKRFEYELITRILLSTGIRIGKLLKLKVRDVIIKDGEVMLYTERKTASMKEVREHIFYVKNRKAREMLLQHLENQKRRGKTNDDKLFGADANSYRLAIKRACKLQGIPYKSPHKAKHGFVTMLGEEGFTFDQIAALTGNTHVELLRKVYGHINTKVIADKASDLLNNI